MTTFDNREQAFENKFAHDAEIQFKVDARSRHLLYLWAANQMGKHGEDAVEYAKSVLADWLKPNALGPVERVMADLKAAGITVSEQDVKTKLAALLAQAKQQVMDES